MSDVKQGLPNYQKTVEWRELAERQVKLKKEGKVALFELTPVHKQVYGGLATLGKIQDKYGNLVANTANREDRIGIGPFGAAFRFSEEADLKMIYQLLYCPIYQAKLVPLGGTFKKSQHKYFYLDQEASSEKYAIDMEEDVKYKNKVYTIGNEDTLNFLCIVAGIGTEGSIGVKKADLCKLWDTGRRDGPNSDAETRRLKLMGMMDSPDIEYFEVAHNALKQGDRVTGKGFYQTQNGVYKYNDEILGNSIEQVVSYFKTHDEVYVAFKKSKTPDGKKPVPKT